MNYEPVEKSTVAREHALMLRLLNKSFKGLEIPLQYDTP
jgi:hypothetical protein